VTKETQKSPSKNTKYEKTKLKYLPRTSPNYRNNYYFFTEHQKRHVGTIFQIASLIGLPDVHQQEKKSKTLLDITQDKPKQVKRVI
jgi:hypothetical protein